MTIMNKNVVFTLCYVLSLPLCGQIEWGSVGTKYRYDRERANGNEIVFSILTMTVDRDTMINGKVCQVLVEENGDNAWNWYCDGTESIVYEEAGQVYYQYPESLEFHLLYDFNKGAGEDYQVDLFCPDSGLDGSYFTVQVDSTGFETVDGIELPTQYVRLIDSSGWWFSNTKIYENLGSVDHFFYEEEWFMTTLHDWVRGLRCYESSDGTLLRFGQVEDCDQLTSTLSETEIDLLLFPNPTSNEVNLHLSGVFSWRVLSTTGRELLKRDNNEGTASLSLGGLASGVYLIEIATAGQVFYKKVIKN